MNGNKNKVMIYTGMVVGRRINIARNYELLEEVECFKYISSKIIVDGGKKKKHEFEDQKYRNEVLPRQPGFEIILHLLCLADWVRYREKYLTNLM